ncbi:MAG: lytic transglycosylase [Leptospiraceae bacterium]|nr:MAG: lytic transglycosylase [Leptospiraceae bacterium]
MEIEGIKNVYKRIGEIQTKIINIQNRFNKTNFIEELKNVDKTNQIDQKKKESKIEDRQRIERKQNNRESQLTKKEILELIESISEKEGVSPELIKAIAKAESNFNPKAISPKGAYGIMQLMPDTAKLLNINEKVPEENIYGGIQYLKRLATKYKDLDLVLAAYNAGPGNVDKYKGVPPFLETKNYIKKIKNILKQLED